VNRDDNDYDDDDKKLPMLLQYSQPVVKLLKSRQWNSTFLRSLYLPSLSFPSPSILSPPFLLIPFLFLSLLPLGSRLP